MRKNGTKYLLDQFFEIGSLDVIRGLENTIIERDREMHPSHLETVKQTLPSSFS